MPIRQRDATARLHVMTRPLVTGLAFTVMLGGIGGLAYHRTLAATVVGLALPGSVLEIVWCALYGLGGVLTFFGVLRQRNQHEAAGLCLIASAMAVWAACVFSVRGFPDGALGASEFAGVCFGCWWRAYLLSRPVGA